MMIAVAKKIGRATWRAASRASASVSGSFGFASRRRKIASVITMAPSTMMPKSMAPSDSRLAEIPVWFIRMKATTIANGMVTADNQCAARAAEKQNEHDQHEADAREHRVPDLVDGGVDQRRAVEIRHDLHVIGLQALVELRDLGVHALENARGIFAAQQQHGALDDVVLVVLADDAVALLVAQLQLAEIAHQDRRAVVLGDDDIAEVVERLHEADAADHVAELAAIENAAAGIGVVGVDRVGDVLERQIEAHELLRIELELELGGEAAEIGDVGDARHLLQRRDHRPELDFRKLAQILRVRLRACSKESGRSAKTADRGRAKARTAASRSGYAP